MPYLLKLVYTILQLSNFLIFTVCVKLLILFNVMRNGYVLWLSI